MQSSLKFNSTFPLPTVAMDDPHVPPPPPPPYPPQNLHSTARTPLFRSRLLPLLQFCATFEADLMWRGPVWGFTNWLVMEALHTQGRDDVLRSVLDSWVRCRVLL